MSEERHSEREGKRDLTDASERRQVLKLLAAGGVGGAVAAGLNRVTRGGGGTDEDPVTQPEDDMRSYDVTLSGGNGQYKALDQDGNTLYSGDDGWNALENGVDAVPEGGSILVSGRYEGTSSIDVRKSIRMDGHEAFIDHQEAGSFAFKFEGDERFQTTLAESATTGDHTIELSDTSEMTKGDLVLLEEEEGEPLLGRQQPPGESHSVLEIEDSTVRLEDSIVWRDEYPSDTLVYVIDPIEVHLSGFSFSAPAKDENYYGVTAHQCRDSSFENLWLDKFGSRGILLEACANSRIRDCTVLQSSDIEAADGYGVQVWSGCHDIVVEGCAAKECRHPLSVTPGGARAVPSRSILFRDCFVTSDGAAALNCHGGSAHDVRFEGCMVHTWGEAGVRTGAQKTVVSGCEFRMNGHSAVDTRNDGQEMILRVTDTDIFGAGSAIHLANEDEYEFDPLWKLVDVEGVQAIGCNRFFELSDGAVNRVRDLVIGGCYWDSVEEEGLRIRNSIDRGIIEGNDFGAAPEDSHIRAYDSSDTDVNNMQIIGNRFWQPQGSDAFIRLSHSENCIISGNKFESGTDVNIYVDDTGSTANLINQNTYYAPGASADPVVEESGSRTENNKVYDTAAGEWV